MSAHTPGPWNAVEDALPDERVEVDLWMHIYASPRSFGIGDSFRVTDAWRVGCKWFHRDRGKEKELFAEYVTHWMPLPPPPTVEAAR